MQANDPATKLGRLLAIAILATLAAAVEFISVSGGNFVTNSTGKRFSIIGIEYVLSTLYEHCI